MKIISIIIATYNAGKVLQRCLDSIRPQKVEKIELLVIDGGSNDDTVDIIKRNADIVDKWLSEPDKGIYDAWNKGVKLANGEWIQFLGSDDKLTSNSLETYLEYILETDITDVDLISAKALMIDSKGREICIFGKKFDWKELKYNMLFSHGTTLHSKKIFHKYGGFDLNYKICADFEFFVRNGQAFSSRFIDKVLLIFQAGGSSATIRGQIETFCIRKKYHTVPLILNACLFLRRVAGICYRKYVKK